ncbi:MAG: acetoin dehydrogenase dihydrolipoyllysine-residue acetyltransferase subunit, partial [Planctomycetaceae bacterium]|nr:acetoin dehydrogenase dihydrolipoyllysine-residue acetyltransferase subunit [Planctomycetaceae bacterium]
MEDGGIQKLIMPKWGLSMCQGKVIEWLIDEGAEISAGAEVVEVETEKISGAVESPVAGTLRRLVAQPGQEIPVGGLLAVIAEPSLAEEEIQRFVESFVAEEVEDSSQSGDAEPASVEVGDVTLRYLQRGEGGDPAVLVHGFTGNLNNWLFNHGPLAEDRAVYALDLPGHGGSSKDVGDGSLDGLVTALCDWLDALAIPAAHFVAHSMGG